MPSEQKYETNISTQNTDEEKTADTVIKEEIKRISIGTTVLSLVTLVVLLAFKRDFFPAIRGVFFGAAFAILNFILMSNAVKRALSFPDVSRAKRIVFISYIARMTLLALIIYIGLTAENIDEWGVIVPLFFPKITIMAQPFLERLFLRKEGKIWKARK